MVEYGVHEVPTLRNRAVMTFCYLGAHVKFQNHTCLLSGRKVNALGEKKITPLKTNGHYVGSAAGQSALTPLRPQIVDNKWCFEHAIQF